MLEHPPLFHWVGNHGHLDFSLRLPPRYPAHVADRVSTRGFHPTIRSFKKNPYRLGTVLGFVISYRTTSSFERYNEGRRFWSAIILGSRTFARIVWFHVPGMGVHQ